LNACPVHVPAVLKQEKAIVLLLVIKEVVLDYVLCAHSSSSAVLDDIQLDHVSLVLL
jgi:hypothetical protein